MLHRLWDGETVERQESQTETFVTEPNPAWSDHNENGTSWEAENSKDLSKE